MGFVDIHLHVSSSTTGILSVFPEVISCIAAFVTMLLAGGALAVSMFEYQRHREREKAELLNRYNERYSDNHIIQKVVKSLSAKAYPKEPGQIEIEYLSPNDIELFMRFFEEIQQAINAGSLDKQCVRDTLAFYALLACEDSRFKNYIKQEPHNWNLFNNFIIAMNNIRPLKEDDKGQINTL